MHDRFTYTNHLGEVIEFGKSPYFVNQSDLRDYEWSHDDELTRLYREPVVKKTLPVIVAAADKATAATIKNRLYEVFEKDVLAMKKGTFEVNGYKMTAFVIGSKKSNYLLSKRILTVELTIITDTPRWVSEKTVSFVPTPENLVDEFGRNYDDMRGYPYGYSLDGTRLQKLNNDNFYACGFIMTIYGPVYQPSITIGDKIHRVEVDVAENEYLQIISYGTQKEVVLHKADGTEENCFNARYKHQSVFAKIDPGMQDVTWNTDFGFDIVLLRERSEPEWK